MVAVVVTMKMNKSCLHRNYNREIDFVVDCIESVGAMVGGEFVFLAEKTCGIRYQQDEQHDSEGEKVGGVAKE